MRLFFNSLFLSIFIICIFGALFHFYQGDKTMCISCLILSVICGTILIKFNIEEW